jgi:hypothetical protein
MFRRYVLVIVAVPLLVSSSLAQSMQHGAAPSAWKGLIGYLKQEQYANKYGCNYSNQGDRNRVILFGEDLGGKGEVLMNIDGADVHLKYVEPTGPQKGRVRKGKPEVSDYVDAGISVRVIRSKGREEGSGSNYSGTITVHKSNRVQTVRFSGWCGA